MKFLESLGVIHHSPTLGSDDDVGDEKVHDILIEAIRTVANKYFNS